MDLVAQFASPLILVASIVTGALSRWLLIDRHGGPVGLVRSLSAAATVSFILYYGLSEIQLSPGLRLAIVAGCSFVAEDMLLAGRATFRALKDDPGGILIRIVRAVFFKGAKDD